MALPVNEKFTLYLDDEGDYIIEAHREKKNQHLAADGKTPDEAVKDMEEVLALVDEMDKQAPKGPCFGNQPNCQCREAFARITK